MFTSIRKSLHDSPNQLFVGFWFANIIGVKGGENISADFSESGEVSEGLEEGDFVAVAGTLKGIEK